MSRIPAIDPASATGQTRELLNAAEEKMGGIPNILRVMGQSPVSLDAYLTLSAILEDSEFGTAEREAIALAIANSNNCDYCASAHAALSKGLKVSDDSISGYLNGEASDERLQAAISFARSIVENRGWVGDEGVKAARDAGLSDRELMELVTIAAVNILTNYTNHVADTEIDFPQVKAQG